MCHVWPLPTLCNIQLPPDLKYVQAKPITVNPPPPPLSSNRIEMEYRCHWNNRSRSQGDRNYRKPCRTSSDDHDDHDNDAKVQAIRSGGTDADAAAAADDDDMGLERAKKLLATLQNKKMIKDIHHKDHDHDHTAAAAYSTTSPQAIPSFATADQKNNNIHEIPSSSTTCPTCCLPKEPKLVFSEIRTFVEGPHFEKQESRFIKRKKKIEKIKAEEQKAREYALEVLAKLVPSHIKFTVL
ncbi:hypothetical protein PRUPE_5G213300 [Prunus persica]|uniref:Uncharacterized protein n=1 Tax=Prunus persica TaxID=3760 RepID=A0A251PBS2_PRUPE|nr:hypothetical protein PRUPE_5G213300 [Prunus persica]